MHIPRCQGSGDISRAVLPGARGKGAGGAAVLPLP